MREFKVGDRVRVRQWDDMFKKFGGSDSSIPTPCSFVSDMRKYCGQTGTVTSITPYEDHQELKIRFDDRKNKKAHEWYWDNGMFEIVENKKIDITVEGKTTVAKLYSNGKLIGTQKVVCSHTDTHGFEHSVRIAIDQLIGKTNQSQNTDSSNKENKCWVLTHMRKSGEIITSVFMSYEDGYKQMGYECYSRAAELLKTVHLDSSFEVELRKDIASVTAGSAGLWDAWTLNEYPMKQ